MISVISLLNSAYPTILIFMFCHDLGNFMGGVNIVSLGGAVKSITDKLSVKLHTFETVDKSSFWYHF